ncbi:acetyl-CoA carboxylase carboxyltransferase subunit alpha [Alphaproteobacteria bacterium]|nr:acetyl-CoA carboxylase carboxyltransferase subunit alpha [Alphaproteobacteria bacterium]
MIKYFDFEKAIEQIDNKVRELQESDNAEKNKKIDKFNIEKQNIFKKIYSNLNSWQKVQIARHPDRPHTTDYINNIFSNFVPLSGDKKFGEDAAIICGIGKIIDQSVIIIGNEKGSSMETRIKHNFGMAKPEGFRKAQRIMFLAEKLNLPIITFVDTAGAFPGKEAEERGQSESIASSIATCLKVKTPLITLIIGEGGSGGAIALATADKILMLEHSIYSVISPEGCSSILWRSPDFVQQAAEALKITANDCLNLGIIDEIVQEVAGGAHRFANQQFEIVKKIILKNLDAVKNISLDDLILKRNEKFLNITSSD